MLLEALDTVDPSTWTLLWKIVALTALPTVAMAVGGVLVQFYQPGPRLTSVLQHFAAGVVFGALALEMLPLLEPVTDWGILAVIGGYIGGVIVMLLVGRTIPHFLGEMDDLIEDHEKHHDDPESKSLVPAEREGLIPWGLVTPVIIDGLIDGTRANARTNEGHCHLPPLSQPECSLCSLLVRLRISPILYSLARNSHATCIGLLVGIAFSAGNNAGIIMAIAIAIEMCFVCNVPSLTHTRSPQRLPNDVAC